MSYRKIILIFCLGIYFSFGNYVNAQTQSFSYTGSLQTWTVPCAVVITITANGGQGGSVNSYTGGNGAKMTGTFNVTPGQVLTILVGGAGVGTNNGNSAGGGGGGTYVMNGATPLIIAGGGGGRRDTGPSGSIPNTQGNASTSGQNSYDNSGIGGTAGNGGSSGEPNGGGTGGPGGGLNTNGGLDGSVGAAGGPGFAYVNASTPGAGCTSGSDIGGKGGYGGGGGGTFCYRGTAGGGGGYSGGGTGINDAGGGGGGSYNAGSNPTNTTGGAPVGNGSVTITWTVANIAVTDTGKVIQHENTCNGITGKARAKAGGVGLSYIWQPGGQTTDTATGLSAGNYTVTVISSCGVSATSSVTITQPANVITTTTNIVANASCAGAKNGSANATVNGIGSPYVYTWTPSGQTTATATGLTAGTYTIKVVNACGASASATATITQPAPLAMTVSTTANVVCNGENEGSTFAIANSGTPPYNFTWSPSGGTTDTAIGLVAGTYTVTLVDNNGCTGSAKTTVTQPNLLTISASTVTNVLCNGFGTGSTLSTTNGGTSPYAYSWTGGQTNANANGLKAGVYTVNVKDAHGCTATATTTINQPTLVKVTRNSTLDSGSCTGSAWVVVTGGIIPYTYMWSNGNTSYYIPNQCGTKEYCCTITDNNGCVDSVCIPVYSVAGVGSVQGNDNKITIYPNPNSGEFIITSGSTVNSVVEIYNVLGENVYTTNLKGGSKTINISNQPNGIYLYRVMSGENGSLLGEGKIVLTR